MRAGLTAVVFLTVACRSSGLSTTPEGLAVEPQELAFGRVVVGRSASLQLTLKNTGVPRQVVAPGVSPPFFVDAASVTVEGGASKSVSVRFTPETPGAAAAELLGVRLGGEGVAPDCSMLDCDDGDACTLDDCEDATCLHAPLQCPADACNTGTCDPRRGCMLEPREDGTSCGEVLCAEADVCIAGSCERRARPNAERDCRYRDVVASEHTTCATTVGGALRCWGQNPRGYQSLEGFDDVPPAHARAPVLVPGFRDVAAVGSWRGGFCAADTSGRVTCGRHEREPDSGFAARPRKVLSHGVVVSEDGSLHTWRWDRLEAADAGPVRDVAWLWGLCTADLAGHLDCAGVALDDVQSLETGDQHVYATLADGGVERLEWMSRTRLDGPPPVAVGGSTHADCRALPGGVVRCGERSVHVPGEVVQLTVQGRDHVCALTDARQVWCWGSNEHGQLGVPTSRPLGPRSLNAGFITSLSAGTVATEGRSLYTWGRLVDGGTGQHVYWGEVPGPLRGGFYVDDAGTHWGFNHSGALVTFGRFERCDGLGGQSCRRYCWELDAGHAFVGDGCGYQPGIGEGCVLQRNGSVLCRFLDAEGWHGTVLQLGEPARWIWSRDYPVGGCALVASGSVRCWSRWSLVPEAIPGLSPVVRAVAGTLESGCALSGSSTVQCWGDNYYGQLGREGPTSLVAVSVPFAEPIAELSASWGETYCVRFVSGRAACWGNNTEGNYAPVLRSSVVPVRVDR